MKIEIFEIKLFRRNFCIIMSFWDSWKKQKIDLENSLFNWHNFELFRKFNCLIGNLRAFFRRYFFYTKNFAFFYTNFFLDQNFSFFYTNFFTRSNAQRKSGSPLFCALICLLLFHQKFPPKIGKNGVKELV